MTAQELPDEETMLEMVNVDIFPFFDDYNSETYEFSQKHQAVQVVTTSLTDVTVLLDNGETVDIPVEYFDSPVLWKETVLTRLGFKL